MTTASDSQLKSVTSRCSVMKAGSHDPSAVFVGRLYRLFRNEGSNGKTLVGAKAIAEAIRGKNNTKVG